MSHPDSIAHVQALHAAYCLEMSLKLPINPATERFWFAAHKAGLAPADLSLVLRARQRAVKSGARYPASLLLRNICGSDEAIADVTNEAAVLRALRDRMRRPAYDPGKADVLAASGRKESPAAPKERTAGDLAVDCLRRLRQAPDAPPE